ncbi:MAG: PDZ domain-containing protein [Epulopiscium sp.]|nr:PDZ domain-containing protein [Candidatus Epulonipiscium sp.]
MPPILEILTLTLQSIAASVFNFSFIMVLFIIYSLYQRNIEIEKQVLSYHRSTISNQMVESMLQGILMGIAGSFILTLIGIPIQLTPYLLFLLPIAFILALFNVRYLCFSYAAAVLGILGFIFRGQMIYGYTLPDMQLDISGLIALVAVMHLMEAGLILVGGAKDRIPVIVKKQGKVAVAFLMQKYWPIPFALLIIFAGTQTGEGIYMPEWWPMMKGHIALEPSMIIYSLLPLTAALGYGDIAISVSPETKARKSAGGLFIYSVLLLMVGIFSVERWWLQWVGILFMPLVHEWIMRRQRFQEWQKAPLYSLPKKGVRILDLLPDRPGEKMGMQAGDMIVKVNGTEILHFQHLQAVLSQYYTFLWIDIVRGHTQETMTLEYRAYPHGINTLGIIPLLENPRVTYHLESMQEVGVMHILAQKIKGKNK